MTDKYRQAINDLAKALPDDDRKQAVLARMEDARRDFVQATALATRANLAPFVLDRSTFQALSAAARRLFTSERHAWWFTMGKIDGLRGYRCAGPKTLDRERRLYRLGWVAGHTS